MKFLRHLAVVTLLVAVVVGLGLAWNKFAPSTLLGYQPTLGPVQFKGPVPGHNFVVRPGLGAHPPPGKPRPGTRLIGRPGKVITFQPGQSVLSTFTNPANWRDLRHTVMIEVLLLTAVVVIDVIRRRSAARSRGRQ